MTNEYYLRVYYEDTDCGGVVHISEYSDSNAGVQPDTFAMRFSRL